MDELLSLKWKNHCSTFLQVLAFSRKDHAYTDVVLTCSGKFYHAHKMVLTACSDYFKEMFEHTDCKRPVIVLNGISCQNLEVLLDYMYLGEVNVKQSDITGLIKAAECLQVKGLAVADDEPPKQSKSSSSSKRTLSSPSAKNKRKATESHSYSSEPKQFKADRKFTSSSESKNSYKINKIDEPSSESKPVFIKEEIDERYQSVPEDEDIYGEEVGLPDVSNPKSDEGYMKLPSNIEKQDNFTEGTIPETSQPFEEDSSDWQESEHGMHYSPFSEYDNAEASSQANKINSGHRFICCFCSKGFDYPSKLSEHLRVHTGEKPFSCNLCAYKAKLKHNLKTHMLLVHAKQRHSG